MRGTTKRIACSAVVALVSADGAAGQPQVRFETLYLFEGSNAEDGFGGTVSGAGDVNGDGFDDFAIGAVRDDTAGPNFGSVRVYCGATGDVVYEVFGNSESGRFGSEVRRAGDVNADGFDDIIVGEWLDDTNGRSAGSVSVFAGPHGTELYRFFGDETQDFFGISFGGGGDVNADGFDDIIVGAPGDDNTGDGSGSARIFSGATGEILYQFDGDDDFDDFGFGNAIIGDIDADGFDDFMIGAPQDDNTSTNAGRVTVYSGAVGEVLYLIDGDGGFDEIGIRISGAGDINADGFDDFIIGVTKDDDNGISSGSASVYSGVTGDVLFRYSGENETDQFGSAVNGLGDINGDGFDDFSVSARSTDFAGEASGSVYIYSGANGNLLTRIDGIDELDFFGECEGAAGDLNGDGLNELIFGSSNGGIDNAGYAMVLTPVLCDIADTNCDGICSTADFGAWLIAFTSRAPACDQNTDGTCTPADLNAWVLNYNACIN